VIIRNALVGFVQYRNENKKHENIPRQAS